MLETALPARPHRWHLMLGTELLAELTEDGYETPWIDVLVRAEPGLARFLPLFEDPEKWPDDDAAIDALLAERNRRGRFRLVGDDGREVSPFTPGEPRRKQGQPAVLKARARPTGVGSAAPGRIKASAWKNASVMETIR